MSRPLSCEQCGAEIGPDQAFCEACGHAVPQVPTARAAGRAKADGRRRASAAAQDAPQNALAEPPPALEWESRVPVLTNPFMLWDYVKVLLIALLALEAIGALTTFLVDGEAFFLPPPALLIPLAALAVLYALVAGLILGNRLDMRFRLGHKQVVVESSPSGRSSKVIRFLAFLAPFMRAKFLDAAVAGSSKPGETSGASWGEIERIKVHRSRRVIELRNSWRTVVRLYCTPEVLDEALAFCRAHAEKGMRRRAERAQVRSRPPWGFWAAWLALSLFGTLASGGWYWATGLRDRFALLAGVLVLLAGLFRETVAVLAGLAGTLSGLVLLGTLVVPALERDVDAWLGTRWGFQSDTGFLVVSLAGALLLLGMGLYRVFGRGPGGHAGRGQPTKKPRRAAPAG